MTIKPLLINAGNRTADILTIDKLDGEGNVLTSHTLRRGEIVDIGLYIGYSADSAPTVRIHCAHGDDDEYVDNPQVLVVDTSKRK